IERAVDALQQASDTAIQRHAPHEAVATLTTGLAVLAPLPESAARHQHELTLLLRLGPRLMAAQGYAVPDVGERYTRALTLAQRGGGPQQRGQALQGLSRFHLVQAQLGRADELCQQYCDLAAAH